MKTLRLLLAMLLILQNILTPFTYMVTAYAAEEIPIVEINYQTKDNYTPEAKEYINKVNAQAPEGKTYNFYTLSGVIKTVKALEVGKDENNPDSKGYYQTGVGAEGYLVVAYDVINSSTLSYQDWIAATTTNASGKFAIPIEKTNGGVYLAILKPEGDKFRFITSYDVDSGKNSRATTKPENSLNIGVIELPEDKKNINELKDKIPNSIKVLDSHNFWACGEKSKITYKGEDLNFKAEVDLSEKREGNFSLNDLTNFMNGTGLLSIPTSQSMPAKGVYTGRTSIDHLSNQGLLDSMLSFFSGVSTPKESIQSNSALPLCTEFLKSKTINTEDQNKNYYTYNGMAAVLIPGLLEKKLENYEIQQDVLESTEACKDSNGEKRTYAWLKEQGYTGTIIQDNNQDENYKKRFAFKKTQDKTINDTIVNAEKGTEDTKPRTKAFPTNEEVAQKGDPDPRGDTPAMGEYDVRCPNCNRGVLTFSSTFTTEPAGYLYNVPYQKPKEEPVFIYEIGPMKKLCSISEVEKNGKKVIKPEAIGEKFKEDNPVTEGYSLTNETIDAYQNGEPQKVENLGSNVKYFGDNLKGSVVMQFLKNLIVTFSGWISPTDGLDTATDCVQAIDKENKSNYKVLTGGDPNLEGDTPEDECKESDRIYGDASCEKVVNDEGKDEYRQYKKYNYSCTGKSKYELNVVSEQKTENTTKLNGNPAELSRQISESFGLENTEQLQIGGAEAAIFEVTGDATTKEKLKITKSKEDPARSNLDSKRFQVRVPDGTETTVLEYNPALVRLISRSAQGYGANAFIYAGSGRASGSNGNNGSTSGNPLCSNENLGELSGASNPIAIKALEIAKTLQPGFWDYWNKTDMYPEYWDQSTYNSNPYPDDLSSCPNCLFWCTALTQKSYTETGHSITPALWVETVANWFRSQGTFVNNTSGDISSKGIEEGDTIFFDTGSPYSFEDHIAIVYSVNEEFIETIHANAGCIRYTFTRNADGTLQSIDLGGGSKLDVVGFGRSN